jgi:hypothetical protein
VHVEWVVEFRGFTTVRRTENAVYDLTGPLTTKRAVVQQAINSFNARDYNARAKVVEVLSFWIEAV